MTAPGRYRSALRSRDLRLLLWAFVVDAVGGWAMSVVMVVYVYERTGSTASIALTTACGWVPRLLLSAYAGVLADRYERTRVMAWSAAVSSVVVLLLAGAVALDGPVAVVLALHALTAAAATAYGPAAQALVPEVVPEHDLAAANALFGLLENLVVVAGPLLGGALLLSGDALPAVLVNALSFAVATVLVLRLGVTSSGGGGDGSLLQQVGVGLQALRAEPVALALVLFCALDSAVYGALTVVYVPLSERSGGGSEGYTLLVGAMALGGALAALLVGRLEALGRLAPVIVGGLCVEALPIAATAFVDTLVAVALLQVVAGVGMVVVDVLAVTALQRDLPGEVLSRVFGVLSTLVLGAILLASAGAGLLLATTSLTTTLLVVGLGTSALAVAAVRPLLLADRRAAQARAELRPRVVLLEALDLLQAAPRGALEQLARQLEQVQVPDGSVVVREGDPADALYVVVSGELAVRARGEDAQERALRTLGPRSYFGEIGLLRGGLRTATVQAVEPTVLWRLSGADFLAALDRGAPSASVLGTASARLARSHPSTAGEPLVAGPAGR